MYEEPITHQLTNTGVSNMDVQALALANVCTTVHREVDDPSLRDFPDGLVDGLGLVGDIWNFLDRAPVGDNHVFHLIIPELEIHELAKQPRAYNLELASKYTQG